MPPATPIPPQPPTPGAVPPQPGVAPSQMPQPSKHPWWHWPLAVLVWIWRHLGYKGRIMVMTLSTLLAIGLLLTLFHAIFPGSSSNNKTGSTSNSSSSSNHSPYNGAVANRSDLLMACSSGRALTNLPAYHTGSAPYATQLLVQSSLTQSKQYTGSIPTEILANPILKKGLSQSIPQTQLIACLDRTGETNTGKTCSLTTNLPVYNATYRLTIYEGRTHRQILAIDIPSIPIDPAVTSVTASAVPCPSQAYYNPDSPRLYYQPNSEAIINALTPLVQ